LFWFSIFRVAIYLWNNHIFTIMTCSPFYGGVVLDLSFFAHFWNMSFLFFYLKHFIFILHLVLIVINTFSHILICMFDEIIKKKILILHSNQKTFLYPKKIKFKRRRKAIPSWKYCVNTMDWIILVQAIKGVLFVPIIT